MKIDSSFNKFFYKFRVPFGILPIAAGIVFTYFVKSIQFRLLPLFIGLLIMFLGFLLRFWVASYNWINISSNVPKAKQGLITNGPYKYCRNPIYLAMIIMTIGFSLIFNSIYILLIMVIPTILLHIWHIKFEEIYLENMFGDLFVQYKKSIPMLLPYKFKPKIAKPFGKPNWKEGLKNDIGPIFGALSFIFFTLILLPFFKYDFKFLIIVFSIIIIANFLVMMMIKLPKKKKPIPSTAPPFILVNFMRYILFKPQNVLKKMAFSSDSDFRVLDLGCGPGYYTLPLARMINGSVIALDIRKKMLDILKKRAQRAKVTNVEFLESSSDNFPLEDNSIDSVLLFLVIGEIVDISRSIKELERILKDKGNIYVLETIFDDHYQLVEEVVEFFGETKWNFELIDKKKSYYLLKISRKGEKKCS